MENLTVGEVIAHIRDVITRASLPADIESDNEELRALLRDILAIRNFTLALANGNTSMKLTVTGKMAGALKTLQCHLRHMTWQTKQVATGDFSQRVDFMGEFSEAFNSMTMQLEESRAQLQESERKYRELATIDSLTCVFNRRHFFDTASKEFNRAERQCESVAILMIDIDKFKLVNDMHGHAAGDMVLCSVSRLIEGSVRQEDVLGRYGGEEFIVLCPKTTQEEARLVAERLRDSIEQAEIRVQDDMLKVTVSVGLSVYEGAGCKSRMNVGRLETVIDQADTALYKAKEDGRNRVCMFRDCN